VADNANVVHPQDIYPRDSTFANQFQFTPNNTTPTDIATSAADASVGRASGFAAADIAAPLGGRKSGHGDVKVECYVDGMEYVKHGCQANGRGRTDGRGRGRWLLGRP
jgi:hypothetical protein